MIKRLLNIVCLLLPLTLVAQDVQRLAERDIIGTARYVGMAGAMTAVGGDASSVFDNPAALGIYQKMELQLSLDLQMDQTMQVDLPATSTHTTRFVPNQATWVFSLLNPRGGRVVYNNLMIGYRRQRTYGRSYTALEGNYKPLFLDENGYTNCYSFDYAMNVSDRFYWGIGINILSNMYSKTVDVGYMQSDGVERVFYSNDTFSGLSATLGLGVIYRPWKWLRLGASFETPARWALRVSDFYETDSILPGGIHNKAADDVITQSYREYLPLHMSAGVAFQLKQYGLLSFQYDLAHSKHMENMHTFKVGLEGVVLRHLFLNVGYAMESPLIMGEVTPEYYVVDDYRSDCDWRRIKLSHYIGAAIGYQNRYLSARIAYQYRLQNAVLYENRLGSLYDYNNTTHRLVLSLAWTM